MRTQQDQGAPPASTTAAPPLPAAVPPPAIAPLLPPVHAVDLMTREGSGLFGA